MPIGSVSETGKGGPDLFRIRRAPPLLDKSFDLAFPEFIKLSFYQGEAGAILNG